VSGVIGYLLRKLSFKFKLIILVQDIWINSFRVTNSTMFCQFFTDLSILLDFSSFRIICPFRFFRSFFRPLWYFWIFGYCRLFGVLSVFLVFLFCRSFLRCKNFYFISLIF
jgi:hypothetical protein